MSNNNDFSAIDRLIDLGMGLALSNQIAQSMNNMMAQMTTPPQINQQYRGYAQAPMNANNQTQATIAKTAEINAPLQTKTAQETQELYYTVIDGKQLGPYRGTEIALLIAGKKIKTETLVWKTGTKDWVKASDYDDLKNLLDLVPPEIKE